MMMVLEMMPRSQLRPVHSLKHIIDTQGGLIAGTPTTSSVVKAVTAPNVQTSPEEVEEGSTVNSIFLNVQVSATQTSALANVYLLVVKNPGNQVVIPNGNVVGTSKVRKFVIHQEMIMTEKNSTAIPRTLFKGVIKLPRGYRRFGIDDRLAISLFSPGITFDFCFQCIYKEYQ